MKALFLDLFPSAVSTQAGEVDRLMYLVFGLALVGMIILLAVVSYALIRGWDRGESEQEVRSHFSTLHPVLKGLIGLGAVAIVLWVFIWGFFVFVSRDVVPRDPVDITAKGTERGWTFVYANGLTQEQELFAPLEQPVRLHLVTEGETYRFSVPEFRVQGRAVYGHENIIWFQATAPGEFFILGNEAPRGDMPAKIKVMPSVEFAAWLRDGATKLAGGNLEELGAQLYQQNACFTCHTVDGTPGIGPSWKGIYGKQEKLADGSHIEVSDEYIRESILSPTTKITFGFQPVMPPYEGMLSDDQIAAITAYIKSLRGEGSS